jgi:hypothetical protein
MAQKKYDLKLTGPQLCVLHELLSPVLNDPTGLDISPRNLNTLVAAHQTILAALRTAGRAETVPEGGA